MSDVTLDRTGLALDLDSRWLAAVVTLDIGTNICSLEAANISAAIIILFCLIDLMFFPFNLSLM